MDKDRIRRFFGKRNNGSSVDDFSTATLEQNIKRGGGLAGNSWQPVATQSQSDIILSHKKPENKKLKKDILIKAIESGFDFYIKDKDGLLPIDYAYIEGDDDLVNVLKDTYIKLGIKFQEKRDINPKIIKKFNYNKDSDTFYNK